jgi:hypothetical protein
MSFEVHVVHVTLLLLLLHWSEIIQFQVIELASKSPFTRDGRVQTS